MRAILAFLGNAALSVVLAAPAAAPRVDFQRHVRPILSDNCFHCHGPDKGTRFADLRLDTRDGAFAERKGGPVIVAGKPEASRLLQRVNHEKAALRMPPPQAHKTLSPEQKEILRRWIEQGAEWKEHWSFSSPQRPTLPPVKQRSWVRNPVDAFILSRLEASGLAPAAEADRSTLIRRVSFDLTGLPPTPAEVAEFLADKSPTAYEKVVDRLLSSRHWGEHRGRYWLDAARYADTHGLHIDNYREIWPYRDWVINAFNRNIPFDQFTVLQLAGDLLPNRQLDQSIASGFNRCNITTNEGGSIPEEVEAIYMKDRVETTSTVFLGLTLGCATCHDHKFDPFSQKDFYSMVAFFKNTTQKPMDGNIKDTPPIIVVPRDEDMLRAQRVEKREAEVRGGKARIEQEAQQGFLNWLNSGGPGSVQDAITPGGEWLQVDRAVQFFGQPLNLSNPKLSWTEGPIKGSSALEFGEKAGLEVAESSGWNPKAPLTFSAWVYLPPNEENVVLASQTDSKNQSRGWYIEIGARIPRVVMMHDQFAQKLNARGSNVMRLKAGAWSHFAVTYDGSGESAGITLYVNGKPTVTESQPTDSDEEKKAFDDKRIALRLGTDGRRYFKGGKLSEVRLYQRRLSDDDIQVLASWNSLQPALHGATFDSKQQEALRLIYLNRNNEVYRRISAEMRAVEAERRDIRRRGAVTHVMVERMDANPKANILFRGQYDQPREEVTPEVPSALPPFPAGLPRNRLGLAKWLVDPSNPLMARVTVNRFWQELFGTGIVKTSEDFGSQGQTPSHPELLDWMAVEFRESGWDVKRFYRMLVTSATYRQSAAVTPEKLKSDPENRLLSRGPRFRMDAEMVRDFALASSGLLVSKLGGPSVRPYQPDGVWEAVAMKSSDTRVYRRDHGESLYRRSLYTFWKRSAPPASMDIFNAPSRENCSVRRERTNTPLQALVTMNDVQFVEAARSLAEHAIKEARSVDERLDYMTLRAIARPLEGREREIARRALDDFITHYQANPSAAKGLIATGESKPDPSLPAPDLAAWTMLANQILNLDEALNK